MDGVWLGRKVELRRHHFDRDRIAGCCVADGVGNRGCVGRGRADREGPRTRWQRWLLSILRRKCRAERNRRDICGSPAQSNRRSRRNRLRRRGQCNCRDRTGWWLIRDGGRRLRRLQDHAAASTSASREQSERRDQNKFSRHSEQKYPWPIHRLPRGVARKLYDSSTLV